MLRRLVLVVLFTGCGDLEADRICQNPPCLVLGRPSKECVAFTTCYYAHGLASPGTFDTTYGEGGTCWTSTAAVIDACTTACKSAVDQAATFIDGGC